MSLQLCWVMPCAGFVKERAQTSAYASCRRTRKSGPSRGDDHEVVRRAADAFVRDVERLRVNLAESGHALRSRQRRQQREVRRTDVRTRQRRLCLIPALSRRILMERHVVGGRCARLIVDGDRQRLDVVRGVRYRKGAGADGLRRNAERRAVDGGRRDAGATGDGVWRRSARDGRRLRWRGRRVEREARRRERDRRNGALHGDRHVRREIAGYRRRRGRRLPHLRASPLR